jgi:hypothetical protein
MEWSLYVISTVQATNQNVERELSFYSINTEKNLDYNYKKYLIKVRKIYHIHLYKQYRIKYSPVWKKNIITVNIYHILKKILSHQKYYTTDTNNKYKNLDLYNGPNRQDIKTRGSLEPTCLTW